MKTNREMSVLLVSFFLGCAGADGAEFSDESTSPLLDESGVAREDSAGLGTARQALSSTERCDALGADRSVDRWFRDGITTGTTYGHAGCAAAYLIDVDDYLGGNGTSSGNAVLHGDTAPTNRTDCERLRVGVHVWRTDGDETEHLGGKWQWGEWTGIPGICDESGCPTVFVCRLPMVNLDGQFDTELGGNYRVASSARRYTTARDSSSSYTLRPVRHIFLNQGQNR